MFFCAQNTVDFIHISDAVIHPSNEALTFRWVEIVFALLALEFYLRANKGLMNQAVIYSFNAGKLVSRQHIIILAFGTVVPCLAVGLAIGNGLLSLDTLILIQIIVVLAFNADGCKGFAVVPDAVVDLIHGHTMPLSIQMKRVVTFGALLLVVVSKTLFNDVFLFEVAVSVGINDIAFLANLALVGIDELHAVGHLFLQTLLQGSLVQVAIGVLLIEDHLGHILDLADGVKLEQVV